MTRCPKCQGLIRVEGYDEERAAVCFSCGTRWYPPIAPYEISTARLAQAQYCSNCGLSPALVDKTLCSRCLGIRVQQGKTTAAIHRARKGEV
jgi:uncharacterized paraquat-inducible protein A